MTGSSSPTVKRRRLAAELRALRERAAMTIEAVADQLEWSTAKISRIENARSSVMPRDVKYLLHVYGIPDGSREFETLTTLARESRQKGWWQSFGDAVPEEFSTYVGLEASAATLRTYEAEYVPGLLQTEDYARAVIRASMLTAPAESIDQHVAVRMARQDRLASEDPPALWVVLNEAVIRRVVGGISVMRTQLGRLLEAAEPPAATIQVLPFTAGAHPGMDGAFMILQFPGDPDVVYVHYYTGTVYLEKGADTGAYSLMFDHLRAAALAPDASRALIARARDELRLGGHARIRCLAQEGGGVMKPDELAGATWRKSSHSGGGGSNCVLVATADGIVGVRDSKQGEHGSILILSRDAWRRLAEALKESGTGRA